MRKNKNTSKIILATIVAILAAMVSYSAFNSLHQQVSEQKQLINLMHKTKSGKKKKNEKYSYAIAKKNLKAGNTLKHTDFKFKDFEEKSLTKIKNKSQLIGKILLKNIDKDEAFTMKHIGNASTDVIIKEGYRALTMKSSNFEGKSNKMQVGTSVDIYSTSKRTKWSLEDIRIADIEGRSGRKSNLVDSASVTFEVPVDKISEFISNASKTKMVLVARGPNSKPKKKQEKPKISEPALPNLPSAPPIENLSGLPLPLQPEASPVEIELIEANVKSKVRFD
jgi:Flp pilus assembly protein CpaB